MSLQEMLNHRRSVRLYDETKPLDTEKVKNCLELATLAPTSSNMQLYEFYHITDKNTLKRLAEACLSQMAADTADQMVVFVTRRDQHRSREKQVLAQEIENIKRTSPPEKQAKRIKKTTDYYKMLMPIQYTNFLGILGLCRKVVASAIGLFRPMVHEVSESDVRVVVHKSLALVVQTFILAMAEQRYDTCVLEGFDSKRVKKILNLPSGADVSLVVTCGVRKEGGVWGDRERISFEQVYHKV